MPLQAPRSARKELPTTIEEAKAAEARWVARLAKVSALVPPRQQQLAETESACEEARLAYLRAQTRARGAVRVCGDQTHG